MAASLLTLFSLDRFGCLDFDDVALIDKAQRQDVVESMDHLFDYLFTAIDYQHIIRPKDTAMRRDLWTWGQSRLTTALPDAVHLDILLVTTANVIEYFYPSACYQARICMATTSAAAILADDLIEKSGEGGIKQFDHFSQRYLRGLPQPEEVCAPLADGMKACDEFYGGKNPRLGSFITMGWLAGIDAFCEEGRFAQELPSQFASNSSRNQHTEWSVEKYPYYLRNIAGLSVPYLVPIFKPSHHAEVPIDLWISGIPDLTQFILLANDIFSFPKEVLALDNLNYLSLITRARRQDSRTSLFGSSDGLWTLRDTLYEAFGQILNAISAVDKLFINFPRSLSEEFQAAQTSWTEEKLKAEKEKLENARLLAKQWGEFRLGYIGYHIEAPRYRLHSVRARFRGTPDTTADVGVAAAAA